jgi:hypothetical protein
MDTLWIVHRDARARAALGRLAGPGSGARLGAPDDGAFERLPVPPVVVLGLAGDLETELEFALRQATRRPDAHWVLVHERGLERVTRLFAGLPATFLAWPPAGEELRRRIEPRGALGQTASLARRRERAALLGRLERWFGDLELPTLERARALGADRILVRGEPGSGRLLAVRAFHAVAARPDDAFVALPCAADTSLAALAGAARAEARRSASLTLCLEDVDRLPRDVQRALLGWIELGAPDPALATTRLHWMATAAPPDPAWEAEGCRLEPGLGDALAALVVRIPPLRERPDFIEPFVIATAADWCARRGVEPPGFSEEALAALRDHPWPGNLRELEAVVVRTLAQGPVHPVREVDLRFDPAPPAAGPWAARGSEEDAEAVIERLGEAEEAPAPPAAAAAPAALPGPAPLEPAPPAPVPVEPAPAAAPAVEPLVPRLVRSLAHEMRNPLVAIRTFAGLLPERFDDAEFRGRFRAQVGEDLARIEGLVERLSRFASLGAPHVEPVDVTALLEAILEERRPLIQERRLLVLQELDMTRPLALADEGLLRFAFEALLDRALAWLPDRADLFVASKFHAAGLRGGPSVRVLLRFYSPGGGRPPGLAPAHADVSARDSALELVLAEHLLRAQGAEMRLDATAADETLLVVDLPARG